MSKFLGFMRRSYKSLLLLLGALAVAGVGYFDTYPTYLKSTVVLSDIECSQTAALVAVYAFSLQNPGVAVPEAAVVETSKATRLAKRVAKYIIEKSPGLESAPPGMLYEGLLQSCIMSGGVAELK